MASDKRSVYIILFIILAINVFLTVQGIGWGLPDRWNVDQQVTEALKMAAKKTLISNDFYHPPLYAYLLILILAPYVAYLKLCNYPLDQVASLAADSWVKVASIFPDFASNLFILARLFSCLLGVFTVVLVFFIARRICSTSMALLASGMLAFTMGFVGANHLEISTSLINFLGVVVVYFCLKALDTRKLSAIVIASFCAGLAMATKLNGIFLTPLPFIVLFMSRWGSSHILRKFTMLATVLAAGFFAGWPTFFAMLSSFKIGYKCYADFLFLSRANVPIMINLVNYLIQLVVVFGIPFSVFIIYGLFVAAKQIAFKDASSDKLLIIIILVISYMLMNGISVHHQHPYTKYIVFIVPQLAVIGGLGAYMLLRRVPVILRFIITALVFGYSVAYTISGNAQFIKKDVRYRSTTWIERNIPKGSTIEHVDQMDWLFSSKIIKDYRIIYLGRDSVTYVSKSFYKLNKNGDLKDAARMIEEYCLNLNANMPKSEYFVIFLPETSELTSSTRSVSQYDRLIRNFIDNKFPYDPVATFKISNWREVSSVIKGLSYPHNILWEPIPDNAYMPSIIMIYKRRSMS